MQIFQFDDNAQEIIDDITMCSKTIASTLNRLLDNYPDPIAIIGLLFTLTYALKMCLPIQEPNVQMSFLKILESSLHTANIKSTMRLAEGKKDRFTDIIYKELDKIFS